MTAHLAFGPILVIGSLVGWFGPSLVTRPPVGSDRAAVSTVVSVGHRLIGCVITAAGLVVAAAVIGFDWVLPAYVVFVVAVGVLSSVDLATSQLPRTVIYSIAVIGVVLLALGAAADEEPRRIWWVVVGGGLAFGLMAAIHVVSPRSLGFGDVRMAGLVGLFLGWLGVGHVVSGLAVAFLAAGAVAVVRLVLGSATRRTMLPFGPFLAFGALVVIAASSTSL
jgi:leader peptidase (prepilin peptidase)/N-methyltransferase